MPVRLVLMFVVLAAADLACQVLGALLAHRVPGSVQDWVRIAAAVLLAVVVIDSYRWLVRALERRRADELAAAAAPRGLALGAAAGGALFLLVCALLWALGALAVQGFAGLSGLPFALAIAVQSAAGEEVVFRGVLFRLLEERLGTTLALVLSAAAFGLVHAGNQGATWVSTLAIVLESGLLLGLAYSATRSLWLPIGLHFGWKFTEGGIFGAAVSGGHQAGVLVAPLSGPTLITGGAFGPEASVAAVAVALVASATLAWWTVHKGAWRSWRARRVAP
jgi:membrane protease YdiL (CAAX protease family)